ncbi:polymorphic toxin-type HINT domain-containing protein [Micromonospora sp. NPDC047467]|uniref:polymorphic toxin-type HINT domain-containing protein n=1 Tax=Micromonospora sp. NPDC047467 TaxID=3154814 RepID=UPI0033FECD98
MATRPKPRWWRTKRRTKPASSAGFTARERWPAGSPRRRTCHSFAPATRVLMADGNTRPIQDVNIGDKVTATDPKTGRTEAKPVTALHLNRDKDLADVKVITRSAATAATSTTTLKTTQNHLFWDKTARTWVLAGALAVGAALLTVGPSSATVAEVRNYVGSENMRDLTVADLHTYYVMAGDTPVLVHNVNNAVCGRWWSISGRPAWELNAPRGSGIERNHMPANSVSPLSTARGPAIQMDTLDHYQTASWGSGAGAKTYRARQKALVDAGDWAGAIKMGIDDIQSKFGSKYDDAIHEMLSNLPTCLGPG